jgi:DNA ligase D-like protein (predicted ligase)
MFELEAAAKSVTGRLELRFIEPMLPTLVSEAPAGDDWLHEVKFDGFRTQLVLNGNEARAFTRRGFDWSERYRPILNAAAELDCTSAIIDGEMIVQDEQGRSDFHAFQHAMRHEPARLVFMAFDLLHLNGEDQRTTQLLERRERLFDLIGCHDPGCRIQHSEHVVGGGGALFNACDRMGLEGIVSKRIRSRYRSGRSPQWLKVKCWAEGEFVVVGIEPAAGGPAVAMLARETPLGLEYAGGAAITLAEADRELFWRRVDALTSAEWPGGVSLGEKAKRLRPELRVRARHLKGSGKLRHATVSGLLPE